MKISRSMVNKMTIHKEGLDPIHVFIENIKPEVGRLTIACFGESWSYGWCAMGSKTPTIESFIQKCHIDYITKKMTSEPPTIDDKDAVKDDASKTIIEKRKGGELDKEEARELFDDLKYFESIEEDSDLLSKIYGDDWYCCLPQKANPKYEYVYRIVGAVKEAFIQESATANMVSC